MKLNDLLTLILGGALTIVIINLIIKIAIGTLLGVVLFVFFSSFQPDLPWFIRIISFIGGFILGVRLADGMLSTIGKLFQVI